MSRARPRSYGHLLVHGAHPESTETTPGPGCSSSHGRDQPQHLNKNRPLKVAGAEEEQRWGGDEEEQRWGACPVHKGLGLNSSAYGKAQRSRQTAS